MRYRYSTENIFIDPDRVIVIPEGVDTKFYSPEAISKEEGIRLTRDSLFDTKKNDMKNNKNSVTNNDNKWSNSFCNRDSHFAAEETSRFGEMNFEKTQDFPW